MITGGNNVFIGVDAGNNTTTSSANTYVGMNAGGNNASGEVNTYIGMNVAVQAKYNRMPKLCSKIVLNVYMCPNWKLCTYAECSIIIDI